MQANTMAYTTRVVVFLCTLVFVQVSCAVSKLTNVPAVMTMNGFQKGEGGGGPAACDGQYHSDKDSIVSLSTKWFAGGKRCGKAIYITVQTVPMPTSMIAVVMDECRDCHNEVGVSPSVWHALGQHTGAGKVDITWSDLESMPQA